ncbi:microcephalin [Papilio machaon]|uniref:microcephalin n=1 Tax=Papilio machaon TaxID=76193 RepID=UPI001E663E34|nr:microcephalin [Papilio machaon]XP_045538118.1 microcephalin [Papilio machaon]
MNKENSRSAAGLRRSAVAERLKLREEWSALKGTDKDSNIITKHTNILKKKQDNINVAKDMYLANTVGANIGAVNRRLTRGTTNTSCEALRGVVALVDVGSGNRALALRAALSALGATVVPTWSHLVTHLVWSHEGSRSVRARARALACRVVSPLWVEACAASGRRLPEDTFPAPSRPSDLPSPKTLRIMLKKAEMENISLAALLSDSTEDDDSKKLTLRMSSESDTSNTSANTSADTSANTSHDKTDIEARVNTAPRRPPTSVKQSQPQKKSKRKLFTQKEPDLTKGSDNESEVERTQVRSKQLTYEEKRELVRAGRLARKLLRARNDTTAPRAHAHHTDTHTYRVVLTGMSRSERQAAHNAIRTLNGRIQKQVNKTTTHVLLGSCKQDSIQNDNLNTTNMTNNEKQNKKNINYNQIASKTNISGIKNIPNDMTTLDNMSEFDSSQQIDNVNNMAVVDNVTNVDNTTRFGIIGVRNDKLRTVNALLGAARGCRVLYAKWALDSLEAKQWLHHYVYEVPHLRKIAMKARVERQALGRMRSEYAYDVFNGMRVRISPNADQRDAIVQLLSLCGAVVQNGGDAQNGGNTQDVRDYDIIIGVEENEVSSKWVFDSVAAARMRTTRRYINKVIPESSESFIQ